MIYEVTNYCGQCEERLENCECQCRKCDEWLHDCTCQEN